MTPRSAGTTVAAAARIDQGAGGAGPGLGPEPAEVDSNRLVISTDRPISWQDKAVDHILKAPGFSDRERRAMLSETAAKAVCSASGGDPPAMLRTPMGAGDRAQARHAGILAGEGLDRRVGVREGAVEGMHDAEQRRDHGAQAVWHRLLGG
jgi:hypothetical protein